MPFADHTLRNLLAEFASSNLTPSAGGATAVTAALGVSLLEMVCALPKTKSGAEAERASLQTTAAALAPIHEQLIAAIDADAHAYNALVAAFKQPKGSDAEKAARQAGIQDAMRGATEAPLNIMRLAAAALSHLPAVSANGHLPAAGESAVGATLLRAALAGARQCVEANLHDLKDSEYRASVESEIRRLITPPAGLP